MSESQVSNLEFTVIRGFRMSAEHKDVGWFDILMPTGHLPVSAMSIQAAKYVPVQIQYLGSRTRGADSAVDALNALYNIHQPIEEKKNIFDAFRLWCPSHEISEVSSIGILQDQIV